MALQVVLARWSPVSAGPHGCTDMTHMAESALVMEGGGDQRERAICVEKLVGLKRSGILCQLSGMRDIMEAGQDWGQW